MCVCVCVCMCVGRELFTDSFMKYEKEIVEHCKCWIARGCMNFKNMMRACVCVCVYDGVCVCVCMCVCVCLSNTSRYIDTCGWVRSRKAIFLKKNLYK